MAKNLGWEVVRCALAVAALAESVACDKIAVVRQRWESAAYIATDSMGAAVRDISTIRLRDARELIENSAAAMSARQPGVWFTLNDSGNEPLLFAFDTTGANRGVWRVANATNVDWESLAIGPCSSRGGEDCIYIGDTGDNQHSHATSVIYRAREPHAIVGRDTIRVEPLRYSYSDAPHDVEAMYVAPNAEILLITKRPLSDSAARLRQALVFALPESSWTAAGRATAQLVDSLPIFPGSALLRTITDASLARDARHLAVRTYAQTYIFVTNPQTGRVDHAVPPRVCNIVLLGEALGEGITWADDRGRLAFTSEGQGAPLHLANCPLP